MKISSLAYLFTFSLTAFTALSAPAPTPNSNHHHHSDEAPPSIKDQPGLTDSKAKPKLRSGNPVITSDPNIVIRSFEPDKSFPPDAEFRKNQGLDTLRGFVSHRRNFDTGKWDIEMTIQVFHLPKRIAAGKYCSFHFFFGSGDSNGNIETFKLFKLNGQVEEFKTTWNNRPHGTIVGEFRTTEGPDLTDGGEGNDAHFSFFHTDIIKSKKKIGNPPVEAFPCDSILGRTAWLMEVKPTRWDQRGDPIVLGSAWSMNKGLMIEVHEKEHHSTGHHTPPQNQYQEYEEDDEYDDDDDYDDEDEEDDEW